MKPLLTIEVRLDPDLVPARQKARQIAALLGFEVQDQARVATSVSEITRDALRHAGAARVEYLYDPAPPPQFVVRVLDRAPDGRHASPNRMGQGLLFAKRVMDRCEVEPLGGSGTAVTLGKALPRPLSEADERGLDRLARDFDGREPASPFEEIEQQNRELLHALDAIRQRQAEADRLNASLAEANAELRRHREELGQLNRELEETNRGVVALYAELDERAFALQRASELKTRFLSDMSHEFRTPLNSIRSLAKILLDPSEGPLGPERERQVCYILKAAEGLSELVNDLLDLAKVESGKVTVHAEEFCVADLFSALRGMFRPLVDPSSRVALRFDDPLGVPRLKTDEGKVTQILRNFISNALKFTEAGWVRVTASPGPGDAVSFAVSDTGIGIAPEDIARIFEEFAQIDGPVQRRVKGTGLGLPLSRRLAEILGGGVTVMSRPGVGSRFTAVIPCVYRTAAAASEGAEVAPAVEPGKMPILIVEDNPTTLFLYEKYLDDSGFQVYSARSVEAALGVLRQVRPAAVLLDIVLEAESGWDLLTDLKANEATRQIPVLVVTMIDGREKALALGADEFCVKPVNRAWLLAKLDALATRMKLETILVVDDDEVARYLLKGVLATELGYDVVEAADGREGLRRAAEVGPQAIFLDLVMPDMTGFEVLDRLKSDPATREVPVIIHSSSVLGDEDRRRLESSTAAILAKEGASREEALRQIRDALGRAGLGRAHSGAN